jgi:hypothetical protein
MNLNRLLLTIGFVSVIHFGLKAQQDEDEYDFENVTFADTSKTKTYANPKIFGLSPQRFVSVGWDYQGPYDMNLSNIDPIGVDEDAAVLESGRVNSTQGLRLGLMLPVISKNRFLWQMQANYWKINYQIDRDISLLPVTTGLFLALEDKGLTNMNYINTFYIPLNAKQFILLQGQADLSGNYDFNDFQSLEFLRYSGAALWGKRPNDRKQWAIGISRTYRVGNMNYIPVLMYNYTSENRKWGTEILFPARASYRRTFSPRSLLLIGYELEGQSYRISELSTPTQSFEIRRGELRPRFDYQRQLYGFFWLGVQVGARINYSFDADLLPNNKEFFRGFFGEQKFAMKNSLSTAPYVNVSINFVSP